MGRFGVPHATTDVDIRIPTNPWKFSCRNRSRSTSDNRVMDSSTNRSFVALRVRADEVCTGWICTTTFALANFLGSLILASESAVRVNVVGTILVLSVGGRRTVCDRCASDGLLCLVLRVRSRSQLLHRRHLRALVRGGLARLFARLPGVLRRKPNETIALSSLWLARHGRSPN